MHSGWWSAPEAERIDVVLASRFTGRTEQMPLAREMILRAAVRFTRMTSRLEVTDTHNGLRVLSRDALQRIDLRMPRMASRRAARRHCSGRAEHWRSPSRVIYTDYSRAKGQRNSNAFNILFDLVVRRLRAAQ